MQSYCCAPNKGFVDLQPVVSPGFQVYSTVNRAQTKSLNKHPIKINENVLRVMFKQLSYKYDRDEPEIPLFSKKELGRHSEDGEILKLIEEDLG